MLGNVANNVTTINIQNEPLEPGPKGRKVVVVDYDPSIKRYYDPVDLNHPDILHNLGLDPSEANPQFHQQMTYAVAMKTLEHVERALGRRLRFRGGKPLLILPHAFRGQNAFYQRDFAQWNDPQAKKKTTTPVNALLFGYFAASSRDAGPNLPNQSVFTCLSHDIIAHETTHAILDRLRHHFLEPSNPDAPAFHEGFADIIALLQHFTFQDMLFTAIQNEQTDLRKNQMMVGLAQQFGFATGGRKSLRSALGDSTKVYRETMECHDRGSILVASVFDAFFLIYQKRIQDLLRIATNGTGILPRGAIHPDLVQRIARDAVKTSDSFLNMCVRAIDYLPPVDVTFGDYLRALVTIDAKLVPEDQYEQRATLIDAFHRRGIRPEGVQSLSEESLRWEPVTKNDRVPVLPMMNFNTDEYMNLFFTGRDEDPSVVSAKAGTPKTKTLWNALHAYAVKNATILRLDKQRSIRVQGTHLSSRAGQDGRPEYELVVQYTQVEASTPILDKLGGIPLRGGTTVIANQLGEVKYILAKPIAVSAALSKDARYAKQLDFTQRMACDNLEQNWTDDPEGFTKTHMKKMACISHLHQGAPS